MRRIAPLPPASGGNGAGHCPDRTRGAREAEPRDLSLSLADTLIARITDRHAAIGVIGLGYAGLPLARRFAHLGFRVLGFDTDPVKVAAVNAGRSPLPGRPAPLDAPGLQGAEMAAAARCDAICLCVPTPLGPGRLPDLTAITDSLAALRPHLRAGQAIALESTSYPGTTVETVVATLREAGLTPGVDGFAVYSPEREDPGTATHSVGHVPKLVAGATGACLRVGLALYGAVAPELVPMSSPEAAELAKLHENVFRAVNIGLVNELKLLCHRLGLDVHEVLDACATKPFGFMPFRPGPGLGGHCVPVDPWYLAHAARRAGTDPAFIETAARVNDAMPRWCVSRLRHALGRPLAGARVLVLGIAYKPDIADARESPALEILRLLDEAGARADYHDALLPELPATRRLGAGRRRSVRLHPATLAAYDAAMIVTPHSDMDLDLVRSSIAVLVDTRGVLRAHKDVVQA